MKLLSEINNLRDSMPIKNSLVGTSELMKTSTAFAANTIYVGNTVVLTPGTYLVVGMTTMLYTITTSLAKDVKIDTGYAVNGAATTLLGLYLGVDKTTQQGFRVGLTHLVTITAETNAQCYLSSNQAITAAQANSMQTILRFVKLY
jgi:hypothetical protein